MYFYYVEGKQRLINIHWTNLRPWYHRHRSEWGSILVRSNFLDMSSCTTIKYKRGRQKYFFLSNASAVSEVTCSINSEKSKKHTKLCSDIYNTRRPFSGWEMEKRDSNISSAPSWAFPMRAKLPAEFIAAFCLIITTQITQMHQQGLGRRLGGVGGANWGTVGLLYAVCNGAETASRSSGVVWLGCPGAS